MMMASPKAGVGKSGGPHWELCCYQETYYFTKGGANITHCYREPTYYTTGTSGWVKMRFQMKHVE